MVIIFAWEVQAILVPFVPQQPADHGKFFQEQILVEHSPLAHELGERAVISILEIREFML